MSSRQQRKEAARAARLALEAQECARQRRRRRRRLAGAGGGALISAAILALALAGGGAGIAAMSASVRRHLVPLSRLGRLETAPPPGPLGPEEVPIPRSPALAANGARSVAGSVDGITCLGSEQLVYHVHAHLTLFVDGRARRVPLGVGIKDAQPVEAQGGEFVESGSCFYWLHTHSADGIIHIESPIRRIYTLGQFFDIWDQPLGPRQVGPAHGPVIAIYNRRLYLGNPRSIPLTPHAQIQLEVGRPLVAPERIVFPSGL
jgi:hypothetical protein